MNGYCTKSALKSTVRNRPFREISNAALCYISVALDINIYSEKSLQPKSLEIPKSEVYKRGLNQAKKYIIFLQTILHKIFDINLQNQVK